ncbi:transposase [Streptomyces sp. NPDC057428]|uniref:transposase n=1 Tax=Streptomyces sp. NPDC057428 TaxID=3346129 RepID=UPI00368E4E94
MTESLGLLRDFEPGATAHRTARSPHDESSEFKADAVALYESRPDATIRSVAADLGINPETLRSWVRAAGASRPRGRRTQEPGQPPALLEAENAALWKKVRELEKETLVPDSRGPVLPAGTADARLAARIRAVHQGIRRHLRRPENHRRAPRDER